MWSAASNESRTYSEIGAVSHIYIQVIYALTSEHHNTNTNTNSRLLYESAHVFGTVLLAVAHRH